MKNDECFSISKTLIVAAILSFGIILHAQEIMKLPRVAELEDSLKGNASEYIKARFPNTPFMVTVSVDPLRRDAPELNSNNTGDLPFFDADTGEEIRDEWDDPQVPLSALLNRVKRIQVDISVPSTLREGDIDELKNSIFQDLHLTPARDEVNITRRDWVTNQVPWVTIYSACAALFVLLFGLLIINRSSAKQIARALTNMKLGGTNASSPASLPPPSLGESDSKRLGLAANQELKFNDPIKMKELASRHIEFLLNAKAFPNHQDIFVLDNLGKQHPKKLGAILAEFPAEMQRKLFSYSSDFCWVEALNEPGFLDYECLEVFQALIQNPRNEIVTDWCRAILSVWRLGDARTQFLKSLSKEEAFALLSEMPKAIAVSEARRAFPGAWAVILETNFKAEKISLPRVREIIESAVRVLPLHDIEMVRNYREERDLLDYLRTVDPAEERDIYGAAPVTSLIHKLRPPFYPLFDQNAESLKWFVMNIDIERWAYALFNVPKSERSKIDVHLSEKQKFLLVERFKNFDANPPSKQSVGAAREQIGSALHRWLTDKNVADNFNSDEGALDAPASEKPEADVA